MSRSPGWCLLLLAAVTPQCTTGPTDAQRVESEVLKLRALPTNEVAARRAATEKLAELELKEPSARQARDACVAAYRVSTELFANLGELESLSQGGKLAENPAESVRLLRSSEELRESATVTLEACNRALADLTGG